MAAPSRSVVIVIRSWSDDGVFRARLLRHDAGTDGPAAEVVVGSIADLLARVESWLSELHEVDGPAPP